MQDLPGIKLCTQARRAWNWMHRLGQQGWEHWQFGKEGCSCRIIAAGSVENEEPLWRIIYHDRDGKNIPKTVVVRLRYPEEVKDLSWIMEDEDRTNAQWYANKWKQLAEVKQMSKDEFADLRGRTLVCKIDRTSNIYKAAPHPA